MNSIIFFLGHQNQRDFWHERRKALQEDKDVLSFASIDESASNTFGRTGISS